MLCMPNLDFTVHVARRRATSAAMEAVAAPAPFVALGVLSAAGGMGQSNASVCRSRRDRMRVGFAPLVRATAVGVRFLIAGGVTPKNGEALQHTHAEAAETQDIVFLNMTESPARCSLKYLLWFELANKVYPAARFVALADDDTYIQLAHLEADLRLVDAQTAGQQVLWGLLMWRAYYNNASLVTNTGFAGWDFADWAAVAQRRAMVLCSREMQRHGTRNASLGHISKPCTESRSSKTKKRPGTCQHPMCSRLRRDHVLAVRTNEVDDISPFAMPNGPLFAVSRELAAQIVHDGFAARWLAQLAVHPTGQQSWFGYPCWPVVDSILGFWVARIATNRREPVTLVNSPYFSQHFPWPSKTSGSDSHLRFSNKSIILHGLKTRKHQSILQEAMARSSGPFVPFMRECDSCERMGWSTWPLSPVRNWTCCGERVKPRMLQRACRGKACPRLTKEALRYRVHPNDDVLVDLNAQPAEEESAQEVPRKRQTQMRHFTSYKVRANPKC